MKALYLFRCCSHSRNIKASITFLQQDKKKANNFHYAFRKLQRTRYSRYEETALELFNRYECFGLESLVRNIGGRMGFGNGEPI